jgi:iron complex outermembrane receptor protein
LLLATSYHRNGLTLKLIYLELSQPKENAINASPILEANGQVNKYYSETSRIYLEEAVPELKQTNSSVKKFDFFLRNVYFGAVTDPNTVDVNGDGRIEGALLMDR